MCQRAETLGVPGARNCHRLGVEQDHEWPSPLCLDQLDCSFRSTRYKRGVPALPSVWDSTKPSSLLTSVEICRAYLTFARCKFFESSGWKNLSPLMSAHNFSGGPSDCLNSACFRSSQIGSKAFANRESSSPPFLDRPIYVCGAEPGDVLQVRMEHSTLPDYRL
jgi:hypothetical protein